MSVRKFRDSWWVDFRWKHTRYRKRSPINTRAGALEYETTLRGRLARDEPLEKPQSSSVSLADFSSEWMRIQVRTNGRPSTVWHYGKELERNLLPEMGSFALNEITTSVIERYKASRVARNLAPRSINNQLVVLHSCLAAAVEWGLIQSVPHMRWLKLPPQPDNFLTPEECDRLLAAPRTPRLRDMILCALRTGMRHGELTGLEWSGVDFDRRIITISQAAVLGHLGPPKNNRIRHIPIAADLLDTLYKRRQTRGFVFPTKDGSFIRYGVSGLQLRRACAYAGIRQIGWHVLRHTFASQLVARGVSIRAVQILLGHSTVQMTERYAHLAPSTLCAAIQTLEPKVWATGGQHP